MPMIANAAARVRWLVCAAACQQPSTPAPAPPGSQAFDVLIANGRVVDGTGAPWYRADVGITGDRITAIGRLDGRDAKTRIDAANLVVAPGFIDMLGQSEFNVLVDRARGQQDHAGHHHRDHRRAPSIAPLNDAMAKAQQAAYDRCKIALDFRTIGEYFARLERNRPAINVGTFVGAGGVRDYVIGQTQRAATADEIEAMKKLVAQAMRTARWASAPRCSTCPAGLRPPKRLSNWRRWRGSTAASTSSHQRSESGQIIPSLDEVFAVAERAGIPAEVWHLKTAYEANWGRMPEMLAALRRRHGRAAST